MDVDVDTGTTESTVVGTPRGRTGTAIAACATKRETKMMRAAGYMCAVVFWCVGGFEGDMRLERGYDEESGSGMRSVFYTSYPAALLGGLWMPIQLQKLGLTPPRMAKPSHGKWRPRNPATGTAHIAREPQRLRLPGTRTLIRILDIEGRLRGAVARCRQGTCSNVEKEENTMIQ